jgi:hypothetical protein
MFIVNKTKEVIKRFPLTLLCCLLSFMLLTVEHVHGRLNLHFCRENHTEEQTALGLTIFGCLHTISSFYFAVDHEVFWYLMGLGISAIITAYVLPMRHKSEGKVGDFLCQVIFLGGIAGCCSLLVMLGSVLIFVAIDTLFKIKLSIPTWMWFHIGNFSGTLLIPTLYLTFIPKIYENDGLNFNKMRLLITYILAPIFIILGILIWVYGFKMAYYNMGSPDGKTLLFNWSFYGLALIIYILSYDHFGHDKEKSKLLALFLSIPLLLAMISLRQKICVDGLMVRRSIEVLALSWFLVCTISIWRWQSIKIILGSLSVIFLWLSIKPISIPSITASTQINELKTLSLKKDITKKEMQYVKAAVTDLVFYKQTHKLWFKVPRDTSVDEVMKHLNLHEISN